ncbi:gliding motility lipoprotein GldH [Pedobacter boryungensis]|uniref:Gliding motility lipoprotein GldH n=1 Tax=Pedobacter boryungensis TaxID=869962 RepID=A0ABX2DC33_9SPHI|nr:gliding motility lipoprotein GldH [Pedobacter boryungensis]NQX31570.1 gliding motility lipoprotein GldH [Pedobacter boryungensis]
MTKTKFILLFLMVLLFIFGCNNTNLVDTNVNVEDNSWTYAKSIKTTVEIKDTIQTYQLYFKLRHTTDYRYANLYVVLHLKGNGLNKSTRYQFKLAKNDGEWLGKGSGDLYTYNFPLLTNYHFAKSGKYEIEIEQNMRDNPLIGISDVGITLVKQ